ncbi:ribonuclease VapC [Nocardioides baekrokdamisoli]|uniref:Ribonuclease VapC n=1 Tax=Nocardioides baekrokdamisoli TaxID=1804624 RepID=A0A3G9IGB9_9ACTN|nr:type II toxin-antitoxin system VapC family toxin [Nocardioides baekrokdamisoli]BBH17366.1 ribonuclease VapC [Nocardioides baekrokdamisoli]
MIVVDTNVLSELMKGTQARSARVTSWLGEQDKRPVTAVVCLAELLEGAHRLVPGRRREALLAAIGEAVSLLAGVLPFNEPCAEAYAMVVASRRTMGRPISIPDAQIAAIALVNGATLVTRNTKDFAGLGITLVNPWD